MLSLSGTLIPTRTPLVTLTDQPGLNHPSCAKLLKPKRTSIQTNYLVPLNLLTWRNCLRSGLASLGPEQVQRIGAEAMGLPEQRKWTTRGGWGSLPYPTMMRLEVTDHIGDRESRTKGIWVDRRTCFPYIVLATLNKRPFRNERCVTSCLASSLR